MQIANYQDADRRSAIAGEAMSLGMVVKIVNDAGHRKAMKLADGDTALIVDGNYGVAFKVPASAEAVDSVVGSIPATAGSRLTTIELGDQMVVVYPGAYLRYAAAELDASLDPDRAGTLPDAGAAVSVKGSLFCAPDGAGVAIDTPVIARVYEVFSKTDIVIKLL